MHSSDAGFVRYHLFSGARWRCHIRRPGDQAAREVIVKGGEVKKKEGLKIWPTRGKNKTSKECEAFVDGVCVYTQGEGRGHVEMRFSSYSTCATAETEHS